MSKPEDKPKSPYHITGDESPAERPNIKTMPHHMREHSFKKGNPGGGYAKWYNALSEDDKISHLAERRAKRTIKEKMQKRVDAYGDAWVNSLESAAFAVLKRAVDSGDPAALNSVWDRLIGKPATVMQVETKQQDDIADVIQQLQATTLNHLEIEEIQNDQDDKEK